MTKEEAIKFGNNILLIAESEGAEKETVEFTKIALKAIKDTKKKFGYWIDYPRDRWVYAQCSGCETIHDTRTNFCPNCGAEMI